MRVVTLKYRLILFAEIENLNFYRINHRFAGYPILAFNYDKVVDELRPARLTEFVVTIFLAIQAHSQVQMFLEFRFDFVFLLNWQLLKSSSFLILSNILRINYR